MRITLVQSPLVWEDREANLSHFTSVLTQMDQPTDIVVLPEMFTTGFSMNATTHAESMDGRAVGWMREMAAKHQAAVCGSLMMQDKGRYYNRLVWVESNGSMHTYDKRHLFRMGEEHKHYTPGNSRIVIPYKGFRIFPVVCYDLRFPVWLRRTKEFDYDLLLLVANWPQRRDLAWRTLLQARAIENQCYVAAVNRVGNDGNGVHHAGNSSVIDPEGNIVFQQAETEVAQTLEIMPDKVKAWREVFPAIEDADSFRVE